MPLCQHSQENGIVVSTYRLGQKHRSNFTLSLMIAIQIANCQDPFVCTSAGFDCFMVTMCPCQPPLAAVAVAKRKID